MRVEAAENDSSQANPENTVNEKSILVAIQIW